MTRAWASTNRWVLPLLLLSANAGCDAEVSDDAGTETAQDTGNTSGVSGSPDTGSPGDGSPDDGSPDEVSYETDVRPIFRERCTLCHHENSAIGIDISNPFAPDGGLVGSMN